VPPAHRAQQGAHQARRRDLQLAPIYRLARIDNVAESPFEKIDDPLFVAGSCP